MRERFWCRTLLLACGILLIAASVSAHTLELKDGRLLVGRYVGGTATTIRFSVKGDVQEYPLDQIVSLTFTNDPDADTPPSTSPPADAPPANPPHNEPPPPSSPPPANPPMATTGDQITVPTGTSLLIRMIDSVDSSKNQVGDKFHASLDADLVVNGVVVARRGADVFGRLTTAESAGHIEGKSELRLQHTPHSLNDRLRTVVTGDYSLYRKSTRL